MRMKWREQLLAKTVLAGVVSLGVPGVIAASTVVLAPEAMAQDLTSGGLEGVVLDQTGAPVAGATVTVNSTSRAYSRTLTTGADGTFRISSAPTGTYTVAIAGTGIDPLTQTGVLVSLGGTSSVEFTANRAGATGDVVRIVGSYAPQIDFSDTSTGLVVDVQETFSRIPVGRTSEAIQMLAPTATVGDTAFGNVVSLGGASVSENVYYVNGMNITNFRTGVGGNKIPFEFYDQVQVKTGGYSAEYGRSTGGAVISSTRSGSDEFHGGVSGYWSPEELRDTAPNTYVNLNSLDERKSLEGNIWASGPIWKDHAYFFAFYNANDIEQYDVSAIQTVPGGPRGAQSADRITDDSPYYGGKIDLLLNPEQRLELTYISDEGQEDGTAYETNTNGDLEATGEYFTKYGGVTKIAKYTGDFTDWFTLSALYGESTFDRTSQSTLDADLAVFASLGSDGLPTFTPGQSLGSVVRGNPNLTVEAGSDTRKEYRVDADFYFNLFGDHHLRVGYDREELNAIASTYYSGGGYYRYYQAGASGALSGAVAPNERYVRFRTLFSGGEFESKNTAIYLQDDWEVTDQLTLNLGVRSEEFINYNAAGNAFTELTDQVAARVGVIYDLFGDQRTKLQAFYGRYYLPVAANTNIRLAGDESFIEDFYRFSSIDPTTLVPTTVGSTLFHNVLSDSSNPDPTTLASTNLEPQYQDEFLFGIDHQVNDEWTVGATLVFRELKSVLEDIDLTAHDAANNYAILQAWCNSSFRPAALSLADCYQPGASTQATTYGGGGYVLWNPGQDVTMNIVDPDGNLLPVTIPAEFLDVPKAKRFFTSLELKFDRRFDGIWGLSGSYVWSRSKGNYEGGVKSDNGQDDNGLTQDFDKPGWMDGANGYLPNHREHTFKLMGSYAINDAFTVGANLIVQTGREYGCIGAYPRNDGRASSTDIAAWYCNGQLTPRGSQFTGDTVARLDMSFAYALPEIVFGRATLRADIFNILGLNSAIDYRETGEDAINDPSPFYKAPISYQTPRSVRLGVNWQF